MNAAFHPPSDFTTVFVGDVGEHYPLGAFMLLFAGTFGVALLYLAFD